MKKSKQENLNEKEKVRRICKIIRHSEKDLRKNYRVLNYQNEIGLGIFLFSILGMIGFSFGYYSGVVPAWMAVIGNAILASLLHELEHDLIHGMYFKDKFMEDVMMWGVWLFRGNTPSPYYRKKIHLLHHKDSGQFSDIEEQMIGNGMKFGIKRILVMMDQNLAFLINAKQVASTSPDFNRKEMVHSAFPIMAFFTFSLHFFIWSNIALIINSYLNLLDSTPDWFPGMVKVFNFIFVVYILPNLIRQGSLQFISSNMHYFGDIRPGREGVIEQTQVLNSWLFLPFHIFCFNFGSTHGIHHFVVGQPFYLRQMVAPLSHRTMKKYGVRFNDFGSFLRANRFHNKELATS